MKYTCCVLFFTTSHVKVRGLSRFFGISASRMKLIASSSWQTCDVVLGTSHHEKEEHRRAHDLIHAHLFQAGNLREVLAHAAATHHQDVDDDNVTIIVKQPAKTASRHCCARAIGWGAPTCAQLCELGASGNQTGGPGGPSRLVCL